MKGQSISKRKPLLSLIYKRMSIIGLILKDISTKKDLIIDKKQYFIYII